MSLRYALCLRARVVLPRFADIGKLVSVCASYLCVQRFKRPRFYSIVFSLLNFAFELLALASDICLTLNAKIYKYLLMRIFIYTSCLYISHSKLILFGGGFYLLIFSNECTFLLCCNMSVCRLVINIC